MRVKDLVKLLNNISVQDESVSEAEVKLVYESNNDAVPVASVEFSYKCNDNGEIVCEEVVLI